MGYQRTAILSMMLLAIQCGRIEIRVQNDYYSTLPNFTIGDVSYGSIETDETTEYQEIDEGKHTISIDGDSTGNLTINNQSIFTLNSQWTLLVNDSGFYELDEE